MKNKQTQILWVQTQLRKHKKISRNTCLSRYISRLADICFKLRKQGWKLEGKAVRTKYGQDFIYEVIE